MMKIKLFDARDVQGLYGLVVPHLDYGKSLTEREAVITSAKAKENNMLRQSTKQRDKVQVARMKSRNRKVKDDNDLEI